MLLVEAICEVSQFLHLQLWILLSLAAFWQLISSLVCDANKTSFDLILRVGVRACQGTFLLSNLIS